MAISQTADGDIIRYASNSIYDLGDTGTFMMWIYPTSDTLRQTIFDRVGTTAYYSMAWRADLAGDNLEWSRQRATTQILSIAAIGNFSAYALNKWLFIAGVFNVGGGNTDQRIFLGDLSTPAAEPSAYVSQDVGSGAASTSYGTNDVTPGNSTTNTAREFNGSIAFVHLLNTALTQQEIIAQQWKPSKLAGTVLLSHCGFPGTSCPDWSGNAINGTVTGGTNAAHVPMRPLFGGRAGWQGAFTAPTGASLHGIPRPAFFG